MKYEYLHQNYIAVVKVSKELELNWTYMLIEDVCMKFLLSVCLHGTTWLPLERF
jgi:hypothetical protein